MSDENRVSLAAQRIRRRLGDAIGEREAGRRWLEAKKRVNLRLIRSAEDLEQLAQSLQEENETVFSICGRILLVEARRIRGANNDEQVPLLPQGNDLTFGRYLVESKSITVAQLSEVLEEQGKRRKSLGALAIDQGYLTPPQVLEILRVQNESGKRFGDAALELKMLSSARLEALLRQQNADTPSIEELVLSMKLMPPDELRQARANFDAKYEKKTG